MLSKNNEKVIETVAGRGRSPVHTQGLLVEKKKASMESQYELL